MSRTTGYRLIEAVERTRLAVPMALLMAGASAFLCYAVPGAIVERGLARAGVAAMTFDMAERALLMLIVAAVTGGAVWWLFDRMERPRRPKAKPEAEIDLFAPEGTPQVRRADAHPDAPARRPLFAASDLGAPMGDAAGGTTPFGRPPLFVDAPAAAPTTAPTEEDDEETLLLDARFGMPEDAAAAIAAPVAPPVQDDSIAGMMARLERGLERRGGVGVPPPADRPDLREALTELRRMTVGR